MIQIMVLCRYRSLKKVGFCLNFDKKLLMPIALSSATTYYSYEGFNNLTQAGAVSDDRMKLNLQRTYRVQKQYEPGEELKLLSQNFSPNWQWIIIAEPWCGDGAQAIPVLKKIADLFRGIEFQIILRDENPEVMDNYLTNGTRSIPKVLCFDKNSGKELWTWGPRPEPLLQEIRGWKTENPDITKEELHRLIHLWYAKNRGEAIENSILQLIKNSK